VADPCALRDEATVVADPVSTASTASTIPARGGRLVPMGMPATTSRGSAVIQKPPASGSSAGAA